MRAAATAKHITIAANVLRVASMTLCPSTILVSLTLADSGDAPPAIMPSRVDCPWRMATASPVWFSRVALAPRVGTRDVDECPAGVLWHLDLPVRFVDSSV